MFSISATNRRNLVMGKPPLIYKRAARLAEEVTRAYNGGGDSLWRKTSVYSSMRTAKRYLAERDAAREDARKAKNELNNLKQQSRKQEVKGSGTGSPTRRKERGRPNRNLEWEADLEYKEDRKECCRDWNDGECKWKERCKFKHICSARIKEGKACKSKNHSRKGHKDH